MSVLPLAGVRVLDLSSVIAGPLCSFQLALLGAEIIKVEVPGIGDIARRLGGDPELSARQMGVSFLSNNAGKKSITLDLKQPAGLEILGRLLERCDVLLENFRPGTMQRLGFGYDTARRIKPGIVWCSISGFGQYGPLASRPAYDQIVQGYCGLMANTGTRETSPVRAGYQVCDSTAAIVAAFAIAAGLYKRAVRGEGEFIDVSMLDASLSTMPSWPISNYLNAGKPPSPMGNDNPASSPSGAFRARDGVINIVANDQRQYEALCDALDAPELKADPRFVDRPTRVVHREALREGLEAKLAAWTVAELDAMLAAVGVPAGPILSLPQVLAHPQVAARELLKTFPPNEVVDRPFTVHRAGFRLGGAQPDVDLPPPMLGEHTDEVLQTLGYDPARIAALRAQRVV
ncbi:CoA transferase [Pigmentiphaga soli]|uniref:CoA transferase n=1 Tax=Pigmentiphaga soli TaxID=1007095 RepID=A0ABP8HNT6_9BURK